MIESDDPQIFHIVRFLAYVERKINPLQDDMKVFLAEACGSLDDAKAIMDRCHLAYLCEYNRNRMYVTEKGLKFLQVDNETLYNAIWCMDA
jgi:hypothetical protein